MIKKVKSGILYGVGGAQVDIEVDIMRGLPYFGVVGLAGTEVKESKERVRSSIGNSGYEFPLNRIVVNLSPADMKKDGSYLDLGICMGILRNNIGKPDEYLLESAFLGELSLDGRVKPVNGIISIVIALSKNGVKRVFIPAENYMECSELKDILIIPVNDVKDCISIINMEKKFQAKFVGKRIFNIISEAKKNEEANKNKELNSENLFVDDFYYVNGNIFAKRCAEISLAGGHNMLMIGPPGTGKTMIAKAMGNMLPKPSKEESLEITQIYSSVGKLPQRSSLVKKRPFRQPHHTATTSSIIGGGSNAHLGEITLAHRGLLFLDEVPEFSREVIDSLRQPMEDGKINITRVNRSITYPSDFILVATMNPCPCGFFNTTQDCSCRRWEIDRYRSKVSGPILDRIDLFCEVSEIKYSEISMGVKENEKSINIMSRIEKARAVQRKRFINLNIDTNSQMGSDEILEFCKTTKKAEELLRQLYERYGLSNRSYIRILKVARTIADLENSKLIKEKHIAESFSFKKAFFKYFSRR